MMKERKFRIENITKTHVALAQLGCEFFDEKEVVDIYFDVPTDRVEKIVEAGRKQMLVCLEKKGNAFVITKKIALKNVEDAISERAKKYGIKAVLHRHSWYWKSSSGLVITTHNISGRGNFLIFRDEAIEQKFEEIQKILSAFGITEQEYITMPFCHLPETEEVRLRTNVAVFLFLKKGDEYFLIQRAHTGYMDGWWGPPSGHVQEEESLYSAIIRETEEEAGVKIDREDICHIHTSYRHRGRSYIDFYFICEKWEGEPYAAEKEKAAECGWFSIDTMPEKTVDYVKKALIANARGEYFAEQGWALIR